MENEKDKIMPDGRPLYAWENEIRMLRSENKRMRERIDETALFQKMMGIVWKKWTDYPKNEWHFVVRRDDAIIDPLFKENLEKYLHLI